MRILVLSFYFEPDLCAGSFRNTALVRTLSQKLGTEDEVVVITTAPNRYHSYSVSAPEYEINGNISVHRIPLPSHRSNFVDQNRAFVSYARGVFHITRKRSYDLVYASSSRLMTATLGVIVAYRQGAPLYLDIRDIFTETMRDLFSRSPVRLLLPLFRLLERFSIRCAERVNLVSPAFVEYFSEIDPTKSYRVFINGIDQMDDGCPDGQLHHSGYKEILYAGNIGEGQGLHRIIPDIAKRLDPSWRIRIIGGGGRYETLEKSVSGLDNVILETPMPRCQLVDRYRMAEVLLLHLNDFSSFKRVLPSKVFEYAASGKPIIAGVQGYAATFLSDKVENVAIFPPCDVDAFFKALGALRLENTPRRAFCDRYQRSLITNEMVADVLSLVSSDYRNLASIVG